MKKSIICGIASLAMAAAPVFGAFAETPQTGTVAGTKEVTVGEVDETIYSINISWGDMAYDWKYDESTNGYSFVPHYDCREEKNKDFPEIRQFYQAANNLYLDSSCEELYMGTVVSGQGTYYVAEPKNLISASDQSVNGKVTVSAFFTPTEKYNWVSGVFGMEENQYVNPYVDQPQNTGFQPFSGNALKMVGEGCTSERCFNNFAGYLRLSTNGRTRADGLSIQPNDVIGTITVSIEPDLD